MTGEYASVKDFYDVIRQMQKHWMEMMNWEDMDKDESNLIWKEINRIRYNLSQLKILSKWHGVSESRIIQEFGNPLYWPEEIPAEWSSRNIVEAEE